MDLCCADMFSDDASQLHSALLGKKEDIANYRARKADWTRFSIVFGVSHGVMVTELIYASTLQGAMLASYSLSTLYLFYTLCALCLSDAFIAREGPLRSVLAGLGAGRG